MQALQSEKCRPVGKGRKEHGIAPLIPEVARAPQGEKGQGWQTQTWQKGQGENALVFRLISFDIQFAL